MVVGALAALTPGLEECIAALRLWTLSVGRDATSGTNETDVKMGRSWALLEVRR